MEQGAENVASTSKVCQNISILHKICIIPITLSHYCFFLYQALLQTFWYLQIFACEQLITNCRSLVQMPDLLFFFFSYQLCLRYPGRGVMLDAAADVESDHILYVATDQERCHGPCAN